MEKASRVEDLLAIRAERAWLEALDDLDAEGRLAPEWTAAPPSLPADFAAFLARALAEPEATPGEHERLRHYHTDLLQAARAAVVATLDEPARTLLYTPLALARMPRLQRALEAFFGRVSEAGVDPRLTFGADSPDALVAERPTVAALFAGAYYGSYGPPLYTTARDLAACARELRHDPPLTVIDRRLAGPLIHELSHFQRARVPLGPPYLDECVSGWLGADAFPDLAVPVGDDDGALYLAAWFTQVGEHLARIVGRRALVRAHAGLEPWDAVLPPGLAEAYRQMGWSQWQAGRQLHFLGATADPDPWIKAAWLAAEDRLGPDTTFAAVEARAWSELAVRAPDADDERFLAYAQRALATRPDLSPEGAWRVTLAPTPTRLEPATQRLVRTGVTYPSESTPLHIVLPPGACALVR